MFVDKIYPDLRKDLYISNMEYTVPRFERLVFLISFILSLIFMIPVALIMVAVKQSVIGIILIGIILYILVFIIVLRLPAYNIRKLGSRMESEVAVTGRRLLIQLESGKSLVNALIDIGTKYRKGSSKSLERIAYELYMGKPLEETINKAIENSPSRTFKSIFIQIRNSLKTGADLKNTLKATLEEITHNKIVEFEKFGNKLNPLGLFYMIFGTIAPSLGIVVFVILLTLLRISVTFLVLSFFLVIVLLVQIMFIVIFTKIRPKLEL